MVGDLQRNTYEEFADEYARSILERSPGNFNYNLDLIIPRLLEVTGSVDGLTVLDAGCGEGIVSRRLTGTPRHVVGIDVSPRLIAYARERDATRRIVYEVHDLSRPLPQYQQAFDLVVSNMVLNDVPDYIGFITTVSSVLKPHGRLVLSLNNPYSAVFREKVKNYFDSGTVTQYGLGPVYHFHRTMEDYLRAFHEAGLNLQRLYDVQMTEEMVAKLPERAHSFPWSSLYHRFPFMIILDLVKQSA